MAECPQEQVTQVINDWLAAEIVNADAIDSRNAVLSDFIPRKTELDLPAKSGSNTMYLKQEHHYDRLRIFAAEYLNNNQVNQDYETARLIFCSLMTLSGGFRKQCYIASETEAEYRQLRAAKPIGIDLRAVVAKECDKDTITPLDPQDRLEGLISRTLTVFEISLALHESIHPRWVNDRNPTKAWRLEAMQRAQQQAAGLTVAQIMVAASYRDGDYTSVPFFEPKSISDQEQLLYPFANAA